MPLSRGVSCEAGRKAASTMRSGLSKARMTESMVTIAGGLP
ncbi:MAG: hypothetical protein NTW74_04875 [Acidobacteria bacterium]|nr:hypothetical protein [Acidobacteriota bacterium]